MSWSLITFFAANFAAAMSGAIFTPDEWFRKLNKPWWQPKDWMFPVVWTVLYALNAFAGWLIWKELGTFGLPLVVYAVSLLLNAAWSAIFFGMKRINLATWEAAILWLSIVVQILLFWPINTLAAVILLPYLAWVTVAFWLARTVGKLNPEAA